MFRENRVTLDARFNQQNNKNHIDTEMKYVPKSNSLSDCESAREKNNMALCSLNVCRRIHAMNLYQQHIPSISRTRASAFYIHLPAQLPLLLWLQSQTMGPAQKLQALASHRNHTTHSREYKQRHMLIQSVTLTTHLTEWCWWRYHHHRRHSRPTAICRRRWLVYSTTTTTTTFRGDHALCHTIRSMSNQRNRWVRTISWRQRCIVVGSTVANLRWPPRFQARHTERERKSESLCDWGLYVGRVAQLIQRSNALMTAFATV